MLFLQGYYMKLAYKPDETTFEIALVRAEVRLALLLSEVSIPPFI